MALRSGGPAFAFGSAPRVNLMPRVAIERRERSELLRRWGWALLATLLTVGLIGAGMFALQTAAQVRLAVENLRTNDLLTQVAALQPVREKLTMQSDLATFRERAMGTDLEWSALLSSFDTVLPSGIAFAEFNLSPGSLPASDDGSASVGVEGSLVLTGPTPADIVDLIRAIRTVPAVLDVDGWSQAFVGDQYRYELRVEVDQTVYSGAYAEEAGQ